MTTITLAISPLIDILADSFAAKQADPLRQTTLFKEFVGDFKVGGFNVATAALINSVALAALSSCKIFFIAAACTAFLIRKVFADNIEETLKNSVISSQFMNFVFYKEYRPVLS